jgi:hypothetical protein
MVLQHFGCLSTPSLLPVPRARVVDEYASHRLGGDRKEMAPVSRQDLLARTESEVRLVDEGRSAQRVSRTFAAELRPRQHAQLVIYEREQAPQRVRIAVTQSLEPDRD